jgi:hypothetical protein
MVVGSKEQDASLKVSHALILTLPSRGASCHERGPDDRVMI